MRIIAYGSAQCVGERKSCTTGSAAATSPAVAKIRGLRVQFGTRSGRVLRIRQGDVERFVAANGTTPVDQEASVVLHQLRDRRPVGSDRQSRPGNAGRIPCQPPTPLVRRLRRQPELTTRHDAPRQKPATGHGPWAMPPVVDRATFTLSSTGCACGRRRTRERGTRSRPRADGCRWSRSTPTSN